MRPSDKPESLLSGLNNHLAEALEMQGIPEARRVLLLQMRKWTSTVVVPFPGAHKPRAALEAEIRAIQAFADVDRRIGQVDPARLMEPYPGSGLYRTGSVSAPSETSGSPDASV
ncbi:hypothetical protein [Methylobacterium sp. Leaf117]|uniref:hypothetical protein n=1 Tax=Methylobacterium sp. Leaf117 TaxID=1736260 RepID=UPI0006F3D037|nr:hypothetical protein [Methylobacterium sp. Leaf117]KQP79267.1 hypothetical protein ASF57_18880 [Methylobacterium sp. Leaf117]